MKLLVILDRQHAGKRSSPADVGACYDLDGDGVKAETGEREIDLTLAYGDVAAAALEAEGIQVVRLGWPGFVGDYSARHVRACAAARGEGPPPVPARDIPGRALYVALHVNAGGGTYGLVEYDSRSRGGERAAEALGDSLASLDELTKAKTNALDATERGWACISGIWKGPGWLSGVIYEPGFIDTPGHASLWTPAGIQRVGSALADGCIAALRA